ncbi:hypothetical protein Syun_004765 [Stephania yunnanensis]|uniref:Uncharacterized protein n=1 Tax=Stephania yunnanensis TaxID=152371 RepID=A0AAP0L526_9MAGN
MRVGGVRGRAEREHRRHSTRVELETRQRPTRAERRGESESGKRDGHMRELRGERRETQRKRARELEGEGDDNRQRVRPRGGERDDDERAVRRASERERERATTRVRVRVWTLNFGPFGPTVGIQLTFFDCGGFAIGVYFSHKIFDARSLCTFVLSWASIAKTGESAVRPRFDSASIFPPIHPPPTYSDLQDFTAERVLFKVFRFEGSKIELLKVKAKGSGDETPPSRVMAVTSLLWTVFAAVMDWEKQNEGAIPRPCHLAMAVGLRGRMITGSEALNFNENTIGNGAVIPVSPQMAPPRDLTGLPDLVKVVNDMVRRVDESDLVRRRDGAEILKLMDCYAGKASASDGGECGFMVASWLRLPFYEADFGWGKPDWFGYLPGEFKNVISYLDTKCGEGVEAWVWMTEKDMARFESMPELLQFATPVLNALDH